MLARCQAFASKLVKTAVKTELHFSFKKNEPAPIVLTPILFAVFMEKYDLVVIGAGPSGYAAATRE